MQNIFDQGVECKRCIKRKSDVKYFAFELCVLTLVRLFVRVPTVKSNLLHRPGLFDAN
jgi:hypothetical protein